MACGLTALVSGCSLVTREEPPPRTGVAVAPRTESAPVEAAIVVPPPPPPPAPAAPVRQIHLSAATRSLVTTSRAQVARGDLPAASSTLDRALRIEPNNPLLWIELGRLRFAETDPHQAEGCGRKALALAAGDPGVQAQAGRLLADALRAQRRNQEARDVENQPFMR